MTFRLRCKVWLENSAGKPVLGEGRLKILLAVRHTGSIAGAARRLGMAYRNIWAKIKDVENQCGFRIVHSTRKGSHLTPEGEDLIRRYSEFQRSCKRSVQTKFRKHFGSGVSHFQSGQTQSIQSKGGSDDQEGS